MRAEGKRATGTPHPIALPLQNILPTHGHTQLNLLLVRGGEVQESNSRWDVDAMLSNVPGTVPGREGSAPQWLEAPASQTASWK